MAVFDLYSKRRRRALGEVPDVFTYDETPEQLRVQVLYLWDSTIGTQRDYNERYGVGDAKGAFSLIVQTLRKEYGKLELVRQYRENFREELRAFFLSSADADQAIDVIELSFRVIDNICRDWSNDHASAADDAIEELNERFSEHGIGFSFDDGQIIRKDTEFTHKEIVKPVLRFLSEPEYSGAQQEFLSAFDHQRQGKNKEALNDCLKSFESTMKAICVKHGWAFDKNDTAKALIKIMFDQGLVPSFWQNQFNTLRSLLESSVPTGRNKQSGHGQGSTPTVVSDEVVKFMLNMTASCILFLASSEKSLP